MTERRRILYSPKSLSELEGIYSYIAKDSPQNASEMIERILAAVDGLETFPKRSVVPGSTKPQIVRSLPVPPYMIFFRITNDDRIVRILRIRHGAQRRLKRY